MTQVNPIIYIPPTFLLLAIGGILIYTYQDRIQDRYLEALYRIRNFRNQGNEDELTAEQLQALYGGDDNDDELLQESEFEEEDEDDEEDDGNNDNNNEEQGDVQPQGSTTSARLRMHHEMVQQMRVRAGFAPEPFPGDVAPGEEGGENGEDAEDDGGVGSSQGAAAGTRRIKKVGKKKAEKLQRKEQMRAYHEFMEMQRTERRQQEEMFRIHEAAQQEERQRQRAAQLEKDKKRKEQLKAKEAKENDSKRKRMQAEKIKEEDTRRELRAYIQRVKSFKLAALAKRFDRTEAQLLKDLTAISQDTSDADILITFVNNSINNSHPTTTSISSSPALSTASAAATTSNSSAAASAARQHLLVLYDPALDQYVILDRAKLQGFAALVQSKGRINKKELSAASGSIFCPTL